jgi:large subunit ribosomal protein L30
MTAKKATKKATTKKATKKAASKKATKKASKKAATKAPAKKATKKVATKAPAKKATKKASGGGPAAGQIRITQVRSLIGRPPAQRRTVRALGLKRIRHTVTQPDRPEIRGMINKVSHLVQVEEQ